MLLGKGECDVLQTLYDGYVNYNIWTGYRDYIDDKASYLLMYLFWGISSLNGCNSGQ